MDPVDVMAVRQARLARIAERRPDLAARLSKHFNRARNGLAKKRPDLSHRIDELPPGLGEVTPGAGRGGQGRGGDR